MTFLERQKVRARFNAAPTQSATLEELVINEKGEKKRVATEGLLWLLRGLDFTCKALQNAQAKQETELTDAFTNAYGVTLKQFHNFVVKGIFAVCTISPMTMSSRQKQLYLRMITGRNESLPIQEGLLRQACRRS